MALNDLSATDQFIVLRQFMGTPKQPYVPMEGRKFRLNIRPKLPADPSVVEPVMARLLEVNMVTDPRVRFGPADAKSETEARHLRPWLAAHPVGPDTVVRLTTEGRRKLAALNDVIETVHMGDKVAPSVSALIDAFS